MSVLVDTGVIVANENQRDKNHDAGKTGTRYAASGGLGRAFVSDYIFDEAVTLALVRTGSHRVAMRLADRILGRGRFPAAYEVLLMTGAIFRDALEVFETYEDKGLSFTDATIIAHVRRRRIDKVLSFDDGFDGIVERVDPRWLEG